MTITAIFATFLLAEFGKDFWKPFIYTAFFVGILLGVKDGIDGKGR